MGAAEKEYHSMKERGSDREKGSAKSCQPEIKQAGTLPIPKSLHPPQSHILPLHSLYRSLLLPPSISPSLPQKKDIFNPVFTFFLPASFHPPHSWPLPCISEGFSLTPTSLFIVRGTIKKQNSAGVLRRTFLLMNPWKQSKHRPFQ